MNKIGMFQFIGILIGASLLAACGQASAPGAASANPVAPAVASSAPAAPIASVAPLATASLPSTVANSIPVSGG